MPKHQSRLLTSIKVGKVSKCLLTAFSIANTVSGLRYLDRPSIPSHEAVFITFAKFLTHSTVTPWSGKATGCGPDMICPSLLTAASG